MSIINTRTKLVAVDSVHPHPDNPRVGNVDAITASILANGFYGTVIVREGTDDILAGTHRWKAAQQAGLSKIPVTYVDVDEATARRILLADNRTSDLGGYDDDALASLLGSVATDLVGTGYTDADLNRLLQATGALGIAEASFLDDIEGEAATLHSLDRAPTDGSPMTFMVTEDEKREIVRILRQIMQDTGIATMAEALVHALTRGN